MIIRGQSQSFLWVNQTVISTNPLKLSDMKFASSSNQRSKASRSIKMEWIPDSRQSGTDHLSHRKEGHSPHRLPWPFPVKFHLLWDGIVDITCNGKSRFLERHCNVCPHEYQMGNEDCYDQMNDFFCQTTFRSRGKWYKDFYHPLELQTLNEQRMPGGVTAMQDNITVHTKTLLKASFTYLFQS